MEPLARVRDKVSQLWGEASSILAKRDELFGFLKYDESEPTKEEIQNSYRLVREVAGDYAAWYAAARHLVFSNLPECKEEFEALYADCRKQLIETVGGRDIPTDWALTRFEKCFSVQVGLVRSIPSAIESRALGLRGILARDLMDDELSAARHLLDNGYDREAGTIAGVVLERHLKLLCDRHGESVGERDTLGQLNDRLRRHYPDAAEYRRVQFLNEVRATCAHDKAKPPDPEMVSQLISGVQGFISAVI